MIGHKNPTFKQYLKLTKRQPRHVLQKAQEIYIKVQILRKAKGLSENPVNPIPVRDVQPRDVKGAVDLILKDLSALGPVYGVRAVGEAPLPTGKIPTDVYGNLVKISGSLNGLGIPPTLPSDVYRLAETVVSDLKLITNHKGLNSTPSFPTDARNKKPRDVYRAVHGVLRKLKTLTAHPLYQIPGGVVLLTKESARITPPYVMDALNNALAEIGAVKEKVGVRDATRFVPLEIGKTPSDVYNSVKNAEALVDVLISG